MTQQNLKRHLIKQGSALISLWVAISLCAAPSVAYQSSNFEDQKLIITPHFVRSDFKQGELTALCQASLAKARQRLDTIVAVPEKDRTFDNTLLALENTTADMSDETTPLTFMGYVSTDEAISAEATDCETAVGQFSVEQFTRRDLYQAVAKAVPHNANENRLAESIIEAFEQNGMKLPDKSLEQLRALKGQLSEKETQYSANLNNDQTSILCSADELQGLPADYMAELKKDASTGKLIVNTKESDYPIVMQNAVNAGTRKKMLFASMNRGGDQNTKLLEVAVSLRQQIAHLMGYNTWADYQTDGRMVKNSATVMSFLNGLKDKLAQRNQQDLARVLKFKQESLPSADHLDQWDISYYSYQLQKRDYSLDEEKIREYFPADVVIAGMFQVYSKMLGVYYTEVTDQPVWAPNVKLYAIHNTADNRLIGYFYTDFFPRPGKYDHAAAFPITSGRVVNGQYNYPIAAIVANLTPPMNGKPSLLSHDDVETIFHEFGHIMHGTLTRAPYASLSGTSVAQDFVEAPSQMLENWVWSPEILNMLSGYYLDHTQKLPADLLQKMVEARDFNQGYGYTKQLLYALYDMKLHTQDGPVDASKIYLDLYREIVGQEPLAGQQFGASFGHLMGGYDAGYYGYLWSEVYAQDMFSQFPEHDLMNASVGARYRQDILEQGNMKDAIDLLRTFLGREPNSDAFFKKLHIGNGESQ